MRRMQICLNYLTKWSLSLSCNVKLLISSNILVVILFLILLLHSDSVLIDVGRNGSPRVVITLPFRSSFSLLLLKCDIISVLIQDWMGKKEVLRIVAASALSYNLPSKKHHFKSFPSFFFHHSRLCSSPPLILLQMWSILYMCVYI